MAVKVSIALGVFASVPVKCVEGRREDFSTDGSQCIREVTDCCFVHGGICHHNGPQQPPSLELFSQDFLLLLWEGMEGLPVD